MDRRRESIRGGSTFGFIRSCERRRGVAREKSLKILGKTWSGNPRCDSRGKRSRLGLARYEAAGYYSWIFSPETEQFRYHSSKQRPRKVYDACTRARWIYNGTAAKVDDFFSPFFNEGGREKTYGGERASGGKRRRWKVVEEAPRISISTEYYARLYFI